MTCFSNFCNHFSFCGCKDLLGKGYSITLDSLNLWMQYFLGFSLAIIEDFESFAEISVNVKSMLLFLKLFVQISAAVPTLWFCLGNTWEIELQALIPVFRVFFFLFFWLVGWLCEKFMHIFIISGTMGRMGVMELEDKRYIIFFLLPSWSQSYWVVKMK